MQRWRRRCFKRLAFLSFAPGLWIGPLTAIVIWAIPRHPELSIEAHRTAGIALWMALWWATECVPLAVTALLPFVLFPALQVRTIQDTSLPYGNPVIFLFLGGFLIALAMQRWNLHRRIALAILSRIGTRPSTLILAFMLACAFISMWVTNTATTLMMVPIAASIVQMLHPEDASDSPLAKALMLGIAYSATIGGLGTLVGTVPTALFAAFAHDELGVEISFSEWMTVGLPIAAILVPCCWWILTRVAYKLPTSNLKGSRKVIDQKLAELGPMDRAERAVAIVFGLTVFLWVAKPLISVYLLNGMKISDTSIAIGAAIALFLVPSGNGKEFLMNWDWAQRVPWNLLLLFGGGLSLAGAIRSSGLSDWIGGQLMFLASIHPILIILAVTTVIIFLTEMTSNTATVATFLPVVASLAQGIGIDPMALLIPMTVAASCAFMLPVATPPNTIVYGSGFLHISDMVHAGWWLNVTSILFLTAFSYWVLPYLW